MKKLILLCLLFSVPAAHASVRCSTVCQTGKRITNMPDFPDTNASEFQGAMLPKTHVALLARTDAAGSLTLKVFETKNGDLDGAVVSSSTIESASGKLSVVFQSSESVTTVTCE